MSNNEKDLRKMGRPSSGEYGTTEDIQGYRRAYNERIPPEKALQYRLRQAYNLIRDKGEPYGYTAQYNPGYPSGGSERSDDDHHEEHKEQAGETALSRLMRKINR